MRLSFCILIVLGDVLDDGDVCFLEAAETFEAARQRIEALADLMPGEYVIYNSRTGECASIQSRQMRASQPPSGRARPGADEGHSIASETGA